MQGQLPEEGKQGLESDAYDIALRAILKEIYELVGRPVIERLDELNIPEQSLPDTHLLFASTPCDGSDPIRRGPTTIFP